MRMDSTHRRVRVTARSRQTERVQRELGALTSALRWQHPFYRVTGPQQAQSQELVKQCGWKQGVSAAVESKTRKHAPSGASVVMENGRIEVKA